MSKIPLFDTWTQSGKLLQEGYERLIAVDYDPTCEMVDVINDYDDLPNLEKALDSLGEAKENIISEYYKLETEVRTRLAELGEKISTAEVLELNHD